MKSAVVGTCRYIYSLNQNLRIKMYGSNMLVKYWYPIQVQMLFLSTSYAIQGSSSPLSTIQLAIEDNQKHAIKLIKYQP